MARYRVTCTRCVFEYVITTDDIDEVLEVVHEHERRFGGHTVEYERIE